MNTILFYFSGTGNSLHITRRLAARLGEVSTRSMVPILTDPSIQNVTARTVGFVFPVYFYAIPELVKAAIEKMAFAEDTYFFAVATNGGDAGNALFELDTLLRKRKGRLHYGLEIPLGDNSIAIRTTASEIERRVKALDILLDPLVSAVQVRDTDVASNALRRSAGAVMKGKTIRFAMRYYYRYEDHKVDRAACTNCGICQRICPVNNVRYEQGEVRIGKNCASCFACINYCPQQAIHFGRIHPRKEAQYRFPE